MEFADRALGASPAFEVKTPARDDPIEDRSQIKGDCLDHHRIERRPLFQPPGLGGFAKNLDWLEVVNAGSEGLDQSWLDLTPTETQIPDGVIRGCLRPASYDVVVSRRKLFGKTDKLKLSRMSRMARKAN